jgi:hypothetical protein
LARNINWQNRLPLAVQPFAAAIVATWLAETSVVSPTNVVRFLLRHTQGAGIPVQ